MTKAQGLARENASLHSTMYRGHMTAKPASYKRDPRSGGGYWIREQSTLKVDARKPFVATSTYKAEVLDGAQVASKASKVSEHTRPTICDQITAHKVGLDAGRHGELVERLGYKTTYNSLNVTDSPVHPNSTLGGTAPAALGSMGGAGGEAQDAGLPAIGKPVRHRVLPNVSRPRFNGHSVYEDAHGRYGDDPLKRVTPSARLQVEQASTKEFNLGTTRGGSNFHVPGYSGFIPASDEACACASEALAASTAAQPRESAKSDMLLSDLDQYSRGSAPGYCGFRARAKQNIVLANEKEECKTTSQGEANFQAWRHGMPSVNKSNFNAGNRGCMSFFSGGTISVSDNGKSQAELYYHHVRPKEGLPRIYYPSTTTQFGTQFRRAAGML